MATLTKEGYLAEFLDIREKLKDFLLFIGKGRNTYFKDVSLKLRILYCSKSGNKPLISEIEELFEFKMFVYIFFTIQEKVDKGLLSASLADGLVFEQTNSPVGWFEGGNALVDINTALAHEEVRFNNKMYSYKSIVEVHADKMGGAHVDKNVKDEDLSLHQDNFMGGGLPIAQRAILDLAKSTITLIDIVEEYIISKKFNKFIKPKN